MILHDQKIPDNRRPGVALMLVALLLPVFFGFFALTIDIGSAMERRRLLQATADTVAVSVANRANRGFTQTQQLTLGNSVRALNMSASNTLGWNLGTIDTINNPPRSGPYTGNTDFYEVIVSANITGIFAPIVGWLGPSRVVARAVAGLDDDDAVETIVGLDPCANPGIDFSGGPTLSVDGAIMTNSGYGGIDQNGQSVTVGSLPTGNSAVNLGGSANIYAKTLYVRGGVNTLNGINDFTTRTSTPNPLRANVRRMLVDPLATLPVPNASNTPSISNWTSRQPAITYSGGQATINPGIYADISVGSNQTLRLNPGVYIISPQSNSQGLNVAGSLIGSNVMFYLTSNNFIGNTFDQRDGAVAPRSELPSQTGDCPLPDNTTGEGNNIIYARVNFSSNGREINLSGINNPASPFHNMLIFQRRRNQQIIDLSPRGTPAANFNGIIYAKWARLQLTSNARVNVSYPLAVGSFSLSGNSILNVAPTNIGWTLSTIPFLVE